MANNISTSDAAPLLTSSLRNAQYIRTELQAAPGAHTQFETNVGQKLNEIMAAVGAEGSPVQKQRFGSSTSLTREQLVASRPGVGVAVGAHNSLEALAPPLSRNEQPIVVQGAYTGNGGSAPEGPGRSKFIRGVSTPKPGLH